MYNNQGKHRDNCLCWQDCKHFFPDDREKNCDIANGLFEMDVSCGLVTPVWECPKYEGPQAINVDAEIEVSDKFIEYLMEAFLLKLN